MWQPSCTPVRALLKSGKTQGSHLEIGGVTFGRARDQAPSIIPLDIGWGLDSLHSIEFTKNPDSRTDPADVTPINGTRLPLTQRRHNPG